MNNKNNFQFNQKGFGLIEAVVGIIVALIIILSFTALITRAVTYSSINGKQLKATLYLQEMVEVAKDLEQFNAGWNLLDNSTCTSTNFFYPTQVASGTSWSWNLINDKEPLENGIYTRWLTIQHVCRSTTTNEIISSSCNSAECDPNNPAEYSSTTKKIIAEIEWIEAPGKTVTTTLEAYLYNFNP